MYEDGRDNERSSVDQKPSPSEPDAAWFAWMCVWGVIGAALTILVNICVHDWCDRDLVRLSHLSTTSQIDQLRRGEIDCLVQPEPAFVDELLSDAACAAKVRDLYVGGDCSDPRLGRLRELPNLKCIVFLFPDSPHALLNQLRGVPTVEELTFDHARLSAADVLSIASLPNLRSLAISGYGVAANELAPLKGNRTLERLVLQRSPADKGLIPVLQSMPRLREFSLGAVDETSEASLKAFAEVLKQSLPRCKCRVWGDGR
jgi:DNA-binding transcriptional LysR family regulator